MSIRRLKTLVAVAENGTFAAAAEVICVSHAAVSQQMKALESELQVKIFDRAGRTPVLNPTGLALVSKAREVIRAYQQMLESAGDADSLMGELAIGALPTGMTSLVPQAIRAIKDQYPGLHIRVVPGLSAELLPQLDRGVLDAAILSEPAEPLNHLVWEPFAREPLILLTAESETQTDPRLLLQSRPYIRFNRRAWVGRLIDQWLQQEKIVVQESMELDTLESIASMVFHQLGVSIVPQPCVPPEIRWPLRHLSLGPTARPRVLGVACRQDSPRINMVKVLLAELRSRVAVAGIAESSTGKDSVFSHQRQGNVIQ